ncbi:MAG: hypothetical protein K6F09_06290 [Clostridiales bacterium]|nr:hypothetical protein [Clostridiales bacterium]
MNKKLLITVISLLACCTVIMSSMIFGVSAADTAKVSVGSVKGDPGETVEVDVVLSDNPGLTSLGLDVAYDTSKLELVGVSDGGVLNGYGSSSSYDGNKYKLYWSDDLAEKDNTSTGKIATLKFKVLDKMDSDTDISISAPVGYTFDSELNDVNVSASGGKVSPKTVTTTKPTTEKTTTTKASTTASTTRGSSSSTTTTRRSTNTTPYRPLTTFSNFEDIELTETITDESLTDIIALTEETLSEIYIETTAETTEETTEAAEKDQSMSKRKAVLIVLMACFAVIGVAIIISIVRKGKR